MQKPASSLSFIDPGAALYKRIARGLFLGLFILAILVRISLFPYISVDYEVYLSQWYNFIQLHGFAAFSSNFANYNMPYLYILWLATLVHLPSLIAVKLISLFSDLLLSYGIFLILSKITSRKVAAVGSLLSLFIPTVFLNSAAWGQCDSIYVSFIVVAIGMLLANRWLATWVLWSLAFSFKLQAIFILPVFTVLFVIAKKNSLKQWLYPFVALPIFLLTLLPARLVGRSFHSLLSIYIDQSASVPYLTLSAPNFWQWFNNQDVNTLHYAAIGLAMSAILFVCLLFINKVRHQGKVLTIDILYFATLVTLVGPYFLPYMHDRYFYLAEVLSFLLAIATRNRILIGVSLSVALVGLFSYLPFLFKANSPLGLLALVQLINIVVIAFVYQRSTYSEYIKAETSRNPK